jgi:aminoglycoside 2''-phosphotransferase
MDLSTTHLQRIQARFPDLTISSLYEDRDGLVNDVVIVNDELVFRFPKDAQARQALAREAQILDLVRTHVEMPVPHFEHREDDLVVYRLISGDPLERDDILIQDEATQERLAGQLATFLRQLHAIPAQAVAPGPVAPLDPAQRRERYRHRLDEIERELFPLLMNSAKQWVRRLFAPVLDGRVGLEYTPVLIHDDLASYHIRYDRAARRISGVIDFGTARLGDPAADFALLINAYGESFLRRMSRSYPAITESLDRARFMAGAIELEWALNGLRSNDLSWLLCHIGRARDVLPIGAP